MGIPPRLRDFQAVWESPVFGLFHVAAFSTAFLPTNSATEPFLVGRVDAVAPLPGLLVQLLPTGEGAARQEVMFDEAGRAVSTRPERLASPRS